MWPAVLLQMEQRIASDQRDVASASAMDVTSFAAGHEGLGSNHVRCLPHAGKFGLRQQAQVVTRRLQREHAVGGANVGAEMYPGGPPPRKSDVPTRVAAR